MIVVLGIIVRIFVVVEGDCCGIIVEGIVLIG